MVHSVNTVLLPNMRLSPASFYYHCPRCGVKQPTLPAENVFNCADCGFRLYFSSAVAVAVFIRRPDGRILLIVRGKEPGRGKLAPPGGFVDLGETAEMAVHREIREEVGLELRNLRFLCSQTNSYLYSGIIYPVLDLFFTATVSLDAEALALEDVAAVRWLDPGSIDVDELAFVSMQNAFRSWRMS